jgi:hypothetical protein
MMIGLDPTSNEIMLMCITGKLPQSVALDVTAVNVDAWPAKPRDLRIEFAVSTDIGADPPSRAVVFHMSISAAKKLVERLGWAIDEAGSSRP